MSQAEHLGECQLNHCRGGSLGMDGRTVFAECLIKTFPVLGAMDLVKSQFIFLRYITRVRGLEDTDKIKRNWCLHSGMAGGY